MGDIRYLPQDQTGPDAEDEKAGGKIDSPHCRSDHTPERNEAADHERETNLDDVNRLEPLGEPRRTERQNQRTDGDGQHGGRHGQQERYDGEALPPVDVGELTSRQHESGHDERVKRDRRLDPGDSGLKFPEDGRRNRARRRDRSFIASGTGH